MKGGGVEGGLGGVEEGLDLGRVGNIGSDGDGAGRGSRIGIDFGGNEVGLSGVGGVVDDEVGSEGGKMEGYGLPNSSGAASDDGYSILEGEGVGISHAVLLAAKYYQLRKLLK